jgi:nicotinamide-nucleotide amidase
MAEALAQGLPASIDDLAQRTAREAHERRLRLATAESCTGGLLASLLTDLPGLSHVFDRGFVTYAEEAKTDLLGVPAEVLREHTAVSTRTAQLMAEGALVRSDADIAVAITGYCEEDPAQPGSEAGLVHFACARRGKPLLQVEAHFGDIGRAGVRHACLESALRLILQAMGA